jgi:hypothetical protein
MLISLIGKHSDSLCAEFDAADIAYLRCRPVAGDIRKYGQSVEIVASSISSVLAVATAFKSWMRAKRSRKIFMTARNDRVFEAETLSIDEIAHLLATGRSSTAFDTGGPEIRKPATVVASELPDSALTAD